MQAWMVMDTIAHTKATDDSVAKGLAVAA